MGQDGMDSIVMDRMVMDRIGTEYRTCVDHQGLNLIPVHWPSVDSPYLSLEVYKTQCCSIMFIQVSDFLLPRFL